MFSKKLVVLLLILFVLASCHKGTCPAYMNGGATGTMGAKEKKQELFPKDMNK